jgi:hypothetical protein
MPVIPCALIVFRTTSMGPLNSFGTCAGWTSCSWSLHLMISVGWATDALDRSAMREAEDRTECEVRDSLCPAGEETGDGVS